MNTILVVMALTGRFWAPQYVVEFPTEAACLTAQAKYPEKWSATQKAVCVPKLPNTSPAGRTSNS